MTSTCGVQLRPDGDDFEAILNFRDVGRTINGHVGKRLIREGLLFRSARPDDATPQDRHLLQHGFGIRTVVDLRTQTEHINALQKRQAGAVTFGKSNGDLAEPLHIPGLRYLEIKLTGRQLEIFLLRKLPWWSLIKFLVLFILGFRMPAFRILGREVMLQRGLVGLGLDTLDQSGPQIAEILGFCIQPGWLPSLVHCTQGKDRTGLIIILILLILGISPEAIHHDYRLSDEGLLVEKESRLTEIREIGLTDDWGATSEEMVSRTIDHLDSAYGGLDNYFDGIGFD